MKHLPLLLLPALALGLLISSSSESHAFGGRPGGPFSNGSYFSNNGTFTAVVRGENLTGTLQFSTSDGPGAAGLGSTGVATTGLGSTGVATIYFDGDTYQGNSQGSLNSEASTMTVNFQADSEGQGENNFTFTNKTTGLVRGVRYFDGLYLDGFANCKTSNAFPNQKFQGTGEAELQFLNFDGNTPFLTASSLPISVTGVRLSDKASAFATSDVRTPSVNEYTITGP